MNDKPYDEQPRNMAGCITKVLVPVAITAVALILSAKIIAADRPTKVLLVPVPAEQPVIPGPADATEPAVRLDAPPVRIAGYGDSSMEWGLAGAFVQMDPLRDDYTWTAPADHHSFAVLGCPIVNDTAMLHSHPGQATWGGIGNDTPGECDWEATPVPDVDVLIASWGPTTMWDRLTPDGRVLSVLDDEYRRMVIERMDDFERYVQRPVLWMTWTDDPSPDAYEAALLDIVKTRACSFVLPPADYEPDLIHLSPQGSLTVAAALIPAAIACVA